MSVVGCSHNAMLAAAIDSQHRTHGSLGEGFGLMPCIACASCLPAGRNSCDWPGNVCLLPCCVARRHACTNQAFCPVDAAGVTRRSMKRPTRRRSHRGSAKLRCATCAAVYVCSWAEWPAHKASSTLRASVAAAMHNPHHIWHGC